MSTRTDTLFPYTTLFRSLRDFDPVSFVNDSVAAARNRGEQTLQASNSALGSAIGGTAADNPMAAFLAQRGSNDLAATLAGVRARATQTHRKGEVRGQRVSVSVDSGGRRTMKKKNKNCKES